MSNSKIEIPMDKLVLYDTLVASCPEIERKGKTMPYTSVNGHMFSFLAKDGSMGLRLGVDQRESFLSKYNTKLIEQHGRVMKEYALVPADLLKNTNELKEYLEMSFDYVSSLKPKPTKKK